MTYSILNALADMGRGDLQLVPKEKQIERLTICMSCTKYAPITHQCKVCHCLVDGKTWLDKATCPDSHW